VHTGNSIIESLLGKLACLVRRIQDLVVEYGEIKSKTKSDRVGWSKLLLRNTTGRLICLVRSIGGSFPLVSLSKFSEIAVVVSVPKIVRLLAMFTIFLHLVVEDFRLSALCGRNEMLVKDLEDIFADLGKFRLNLLAILLDKWNLGFVALAFFLLLDRGDDPP